MQIRIPLEYILRTTSLTWPDLRFGLERAFVDEADVVQAAVERVSQAPNPSSVEIELAGLLRSEVRRVPVLLDELAESSGRASASIEKKWLYIVLSWLYDQKESLSDPLGMVEEVYADFRYPEEMAGFVRYMPPPDDYRPQDHTREENLNRLFQLWSEYLMSQRP